MTDLDHDVRDALQRLAAQAAPPRGADAADAAIALSRRQRRNRAAWAGGAVVLAVLAGAVPAVLPDAGPVPGQAATGRTQQAVSALLDLPTRGSLAGDEAFVAGVAALGWSAPLGVNGAELSPPAATRRVLFAGDLPGGRRWAFVVGEDEGQGVSAWFGGPAGATPGELTLLAPPERFGRPDTVSLLDTAGPTPVVVVLGGPGDRARYSPGTVRLDDGTVGRVWTDLTGADGVLVAEVAAPSYVGSEMVEIVRDGVFSTALRGVALTSGPSWTPPWTLGESVLTDTAVQEALAACLAPHGITVDVRGEGVAIGYSGGLVPGSGGLSDAEIAAQQAAHDAAVADCVARTGAGG